MAGVAGCRRARNSRACKDFCLKMNFHARAASFFRMTEITLSLRGADCENFSGCICSDAPQTLRIPTGKFGKPSLADQNNLRFNVTHSYGLVVYGFAIKRELGIDTEKIRPDFGGEDIAERYFSEPEQEELRQLPVELRATAFFLCWTRKEAYIKAHGHGLQIPLASFDVSLTPGKPETLRSSDEQRWSLHSFTPAPGYAAAIITEGKGPFIRFCER